MALNDSNFDYGQDLFYARSWLRREQSQADSTDVSVRQQGRVYGVFSGFGRDWVHDMIEPATQEVLLSAVKYRKNKSKLRGMVASSSPRLDTHDLLIVSRDCTPLNHGGYGTVRYRTNRYLINPCAIC